MKRLRNRIQGKLERKDDLLDRLDRILEWIKSCDTKASILLAGIGITLTILSSETFLQKYETILCFFLKDINLWKLIYLGISALFLLSIIAGVIYLVFELNPSLISNKNKNKEIDSFYFFSTIANKCLENFKDEYMKIDNLSDIEDLLNQLYINAKICDLKYKYTKKGILFSTLGIFGLIFMFLVGVVTLR